MTFNLLDIILLLASAQGAFLAVLILHKHKKVFANRFLGALILGYSVILINLFLEEINFYIHHPIISMIALSFIFIVGPLHYLYTKYLIRQIQQFQIIDIFHFFPLFLYYFILILPGSPLYGILIQAMQHTQDEQLPVFLLLVNWFILLFNGSYFFPIYKLIRQYRHYIKDFFSTLDQIRMDWLRNITLMAIATI
ncbi:MAG: hypothetical protein P8078_11870, partial [bacterium]